MSVIIRLQNLPLTAISIDIRNFFRGLSIPDGGVHIVGGDDGDAFIAFSTDEDARQAMQMSGQMLKDSQVRLSLSSRNEMFKVIELARIAASGEQLPQTPPQQQQPRVGSNVIPSSSPPSHLSGQRHQTSQLTPNSPNVGNFGSIPNNGLNMLGMGLGMNGNFVGQQASAMPAINMNSNMSALQNFHPSNSNNSHMSSDVGSNDGHQLSSNFNMQSLGGMTFPQLISAAAASTNGLPAGMIGMNIPPAMMNMNSQMQAALFANANNGPRPNNNGMQMNLLPGQMNQMQGNMNQMQGNTNQRFQAINPAFLSNNNASSPHNNNNNFPRGSGGPMIRGRHPPHFDNGMRSIGSVRPDFNRDRSPSRERRDRDNLRKDSVDRRRRSRSRERMERRRRSRSHSRSRSPKSRPGTAGRRDSREELRNRGGRRDSRESPPPTPYNTTEEQHPAIKLTGISSDVSYREIKEFLRVDIMGGGDGTVRLYDEDVAYVKLEKPSDFPRAYKSNGRKLRNMTVNMEGITIERWVNEYKMNKSRMERDVDRDREKDRERARERERERVDRHSRDHDDRNNSDREIGKGSRPSRFNSAASYNQSAYIVIRNLPPTITTKDLSSRVLNGVDVVDCVVSAGPIAITGRHTALAHVKLNSSEAAQQAIDLIVRSQDGCQFVVEMSTVEDFNQAKMRTAGGPPTSRIDDQQIKFMIGADTTSIFDLQPGLDDESCSVIIKGAPTNVSDRDVFDFFSDIGLMPMNVKIMYDTDGSCNGKVMCEFLDPHKARRATTKDGMMFGRGHVQVELVPSGNKTISSGNMQHINKTFRPSLLGPRPPNISPRFPGPPGPNPFVQALQGPPRLPSHNPRSRGPNYSRFSRPEFTNGIDKDDRTRGGRGPPPRGGIKEATSFGKPGCVIGLENVPFKASMDDILAHLSSILKLDISRDRIIRRFDEYEKPTGDAMVKFDTSAEAKLAHDRLVGTKIWNRLITYTIV